MKKYGWITLLLVALTIIGILFFYNSNSKQNSNYSAERSKLNNINNTTYDNNTLSNNTTNNNTSTVENNLIPSETEIASYSTKIQNKKDKNRQGNITITCSSLNNTIVKAR